MTVIYNREAQQRRKLFVIGDLVDLKAPTSAIGSRGKFMELVNLLPNKMSDSPAFHAVIRLAEIDGKWFYGYDIRLKKSWCHCPLPDKLSPTDQRGEPRREFAFARALYSVIGNTPTPYDRDCDEYAIRAALIEEAAAELEKTAAIAVSKFYSEILNNHRLRFYFAAIFPEKLKKFLKIAELIETIVGEESESSPSAVKQIRDESAPTAQTGSRHPKYPVQVTLF